MTKISLEDVTDYLEDYHPYQGYGMSKCPYHPDQEPSFRVGEWGFKCLSTSCGEHGSLIKLYEHVSGRFVVREKKQWNPSASIWYKWKDKFGSIQQVAKIAHDNLKQNPDLGNYLQVRKIDGQIKKLYLGFLDGYYLFGIRDEYGELQGIVARSSPTIQTMNNRYTVSPKCPIKLFIPNWRKVLKADDLYVCYGIIDSVTLDMAEYAGISGISGQGLSYEYLERFRKYIYIIPDRGEERSALKLAGDLGWRGRVLFLDWPFGCKDLNSVHCDYGLEKVKELIEKAKEKYSYEENQTNPRPIHFSG